MALTAQTLVRCGVPAAKAKAHLPHMAAAMREHGITSPVRARMFIAQVMHESLALRFFEEIADGSKYEGRRDLGNVRPGDGRRYKGRGPIQLTGRANYTTFGKLLGLDLVGKPEIAATPRVGWRVAALYFERRGCNAAADRNDFEAVTRAINGGLNGFEDRKRYLRLLRGVGVVPGVPFIGRGDRGDAVVAMTRRLTFLGLLDGKRARFDAEAEKALRQFQKAHELNVDGRLGPKSATALARATVAEKKRRAKVREAAGNETREPEKVGAGSAAGGKAGTAGGARGSAGNAGGARGSAGSAGKAGGRSDRAGERGPRTSGELLSGLDRLDERGDALREALIRRHRALERALARQRSLTPAELDVLSAALGKLDDVVAEVRTAIAAAAAPTAIKVGDAVVTQATPESIGALTERLTVLDAEEDKLRAVLADRFEDLEKLVVGTPRRRRRRQSREPDRTRRDTDPPTRETAPSRSARARSRSTSASPRSRSPATSARRIPRSAASSCARSAAPRARSRRRTGCARSRSPSGTGTCR